MSEEDDEITRLALLQGLAFKNSLDRKCVAKCDVLGLEPEGEYSQEQQDCLTNCSINYFNQRAQLAAYTSKVNSLRKQ